MVKLNDNFLKSRQEMLTKWFPNETFRGMYLATFCNLPYVARHFDAYNLQWIDQLFISSSSSLLDKSPKTVSTQTEILDMFALNQNKEFQVSLVKSKSFSYLMRIRGELVSVNSALFSVRNVKICLFVCAASIYYDFSKEEWRVQVYLITI